MSYKTIKTLYRTLKDSKNEVIYSLRVKYTKIFGRSEYNIKKGYLHRRSYKYFDDLQNTDNWQKEVYETARKYFDSSDSEHVIDLGCGSGFKLLKYFSDINTTGIDVSPTYEALIEKYPDHKWLKVGEADMSSLNADIVICSDVIEHVLDPDELLNKIKKIKEVKYIILSTPDRSILPSAKPFGPPLNVTHIREWGFEEFNDYISNHFDVIEHFISNRKQYTQCLVCKILAN